MKYIFVDVDGVINPDNKITGFKPVKVSTDGLPEYLQNRTEVFLSRKQATWLKELSERTGAKLIWGSSWRQYANEAIGDKIGLPQMPHLNTKEVKGEQSYGKMKANLADRYTKGSKYVYFDDQADLGVYIRSSNGLHIYTDPRVGITKSHIQLAESFLLS